MTSLPAAMTRVRVAAAAAGAVLAWTASAAAQAPLQPQPDVVTPVARGWVFTPSFSYGFNWDDNILLQGRGEDTRKDVLNALSPRGALDFRDKRTQFSAAYDGNILLYSRVGDLNAYDQRANASARRILSRRATLFAATNFAIAPTTSLVEIVGAPFVRLGSRVYDARGGVELTLSKKASLSTAYTFQWVSFGNPFRDGQVPLRGGHSHGARGTYRYGLGSRLSLTADYDLQHARISGFGQLLPGTTVLPEGGAAGEPPRQDTFDVQNGALGIERRHSPTLSYSAAFGLSRLGLSSTGTTRLGPMWRLGLTRQFERTVIDLGYSRSFVPSYGFGGTVQNEQVTALARVPLARRLSSHGSLSWRRNEPLTNGDPSLWSWWIEAGVAYMVRPWLHVDAFYATDRQRIDRPGGQIVRNRIGVQFATGRAVRIH